MRYALFAIGLMGLASPSAAGDVRNAVVKIYAEHRYPDTQRPWSSGIPYTSTGSGVALDGGLILTNAHVVSNQTLLRVRRNGHSRKHVARVVAVSHEADLALLTVGEPGFFEGNTAVALRASGNPAARDRLRLSCRR